MKQQDRATTAGIAALRNIYERPGTIGAFDASSSGAWRTQWHTPPHGPYLFDRAAPGKHHGGVGGGPTGAWGGRPWS